MQITRSKLRQFIREAIRGEFPLPPDRPSEWEDEPDYADIARGEIEGERMADLVGGGSPEEQRAKEIALRHFNDEALMPGEVIIGVSLVEVEPGENPLESSIVWIDFEDESGHMDDIEIEIYKGKASSYRGGGDVDDREDFYADI